MSLWGKFDRKPQTNTAVATVTVTAANSTVVGVNTKFADDFKAGDYLYVGNNNYVFTLISNNGIATVRSANPGGTLVGAQSNADYIVSEKPLYVTYAHSAPLDANNVYGVSTAELSGTSGILSVAVTNGGNNYASAPAVSFTGGGSGAVATATLVANAVTAVVVSNTGSGFAVGTTVVFTGGNTTNQVATGTVTLQPSERASVTHAGWTLRTQGTGGRAGRVFYETLVAGSSITTNPNDADDDSKLPE